MKSVSIKKTENGYVVIYKDDNEQEYVYRSIDDLFMLEEVAKRFLHRRVTVKER